MAGSRSGAPYALARVLVVAAGVADEPMRVYTEGLAGYMCFASLHHAATRTIKESEGTPVKLARYEERPSVRPGEGKKRG